MWPMAIPVTRSELLLWFTTTVEGVVTAIATRGKKKKAGAKAQQILALITAETHGPATITPALPVQLPGLQQLQAGLT